MSPLSTALTATILFTRLLRSSTPLILRLIHRQVVRSIFPSPPHEPIGDDAKTVVVVGASFAGYHAAKELAAGVPRGWRVVVVERRSHFLNTWVLPRFSVVGEGNHEKKAFVPYGGYLGRREEAVVEWVQGVVVGVEEKHVVLNSGRRIRFEYLVVATGSSGTVPSRIEAEDKSGGVRELRDVQEKIKEAGRIVVVGGGAAGVEIAADAKTYYPQKEVVLVHSRDRLLHHFGPKAHEGAVEALRGIGVEVVPGERMESEDAGEVVLKSGRRIECDYVINCTGQKPLSSLIKSISPTSIAPSGGVLVQPTLQLKDLSHPHIFAIGEVVDFGKHLNSRSAFLQADIASRNLLALINSEGTGETPTLEEYEPQWWENALELTLGIGRTMYYMQDGDMEFVFQKRGGPIDLKSKMVWKQLGATPFEDPADAVEPKPDASGEQHSISD